MIRIPWMLVSYLAAVFVILAGPDQPERFIDTGRSSLTVHVGKAGLLSAAAHEHWVNAPIAGGTVDADGARPAEWFTVDARGLSVRPEKGSLTKNAPRCNPTCRARSWNQHNYPDIVLQNRPRSGEPAPLYGECLATCPCMGSQAGQRRRHSARRRLCGTVRIKQTDLAFSRSRSAAVS